MEKTLFVLAVRGAVQWRKEQANFWNLVTNVLLLSAVVMLWAMGSSGSVQGRQLSHVELCPPNHLALLSYLGEREWCRSLRLIQGCRLTVIIPGNHTRMHGIRMLCLLCMPLNRQPLVSTFSGTLAPALKALPHPISQQNALSQK
jgi:hypothetical protein